MSGSYVTPEAIALKCDSARPLGNGFICSCPLHDDLRPSLKVSPGDKATVLWCHAGCDTKDILLALDLAPEMLFYDYEPNASGDLELRLEMKEMKRKLNPPPPIPQTIFGLMEEAFALPQPWHSKGLRAALETDDEALTLSPAVALRRRTITRDTLVWAYFGPWCEAEGHSQAKRMQFTEWGMKRLQEFWLERKRQWA